MQKTNYPIKTPEELIACKVRPEEQECTISISRKDNKMSIYCSDNVTLTKIKKKWKSNLSEYTCYAVKNSKGDITGYFFETNKSNITFRCGKNRKKRECSPTVATASTSNPQTTIKAERGNSGLLA